MGNVYSFERLEVYKEARAYVNYVYKLTQNFPSKEQYSLVSQIQRAAISIVSNIAEGTSRRSDKEKIRFIEISFGSLLETYCQFQIALDLCYIEQKDYDDIHQYIDSIANKLSALKRSYLSRNNNIV